MSQENVEGIASRAKRRQPRRIPESMRRIAAARRGYGMRMARPLRGRQADARRDAAGEPMPPRAPERQTMIPWRERRRFKAQSVLVWPVATGGILALGVV